VIVDALIEHVEVIAIKQGEAKAAEFYGTAMGQRTPLRPLYQEWKEQLALAPKTVDQMSRDVERMVNHFKALEAITPRGVKLWVDGLPQEGATHSSLKRILGSSQIEPERVDPFAGVMSLVSSKDIIALGAYTGARINELACLKVSDITEAQSFKITDSKTRAGIREIPIHPAIESLVERLKKDATTAYLIPSESENQYDDRGDAVGKRFGRLKKYLGFTARSQVYHSIRKTLITLIENAGVSEGVAADIVGHEKQTMTYGLYSMGSELEIKREALSRARYPVPLQNLN
jgi:integrase